MSGEFVGWMMDMIDESPSRRRRRRLVSSRRRRRRRRSVRLFMSADPVRQCCRVGASSIVVMTGSAVSCQDQNHGGTAKLRRSSRLRAEDRRCEMNEKGRRKGNLTWCRCLEFVVSLSADPSSVLTWRRRRRCPIGRRVSVLR